MTNLQIWVRVGDQGDYHPFNSPELAAEHVHEYLHAPDCDEDSRGAGACDHEIERYHGPALTGVEIEEFSGNNGISLFWGDARAQFYAPLSDIELFAFTNILQ